MTGPVTDSISTVGQALNAAYQRLAAVEVDAPRLVAEVLLSQTLDLSRAQILARLEQPLSHGHLADYQSLVDRCESGEPLAYVVGHREFYGLDFAVDERVLIPRPETELLVDTVIALARARLAGGAELFHVADVGTGSGAIAISLAVHLPQVRLVATDISPEALEVASQNACRHGVADRIVFRAGDLLAPVETPVDLIAANLPYVRDRERLYLPHSSRSYEPSIAFNGGPDGLYLVRRLLDNAPRVLRPGGTITLEIGPSHGDAAAELAYDVFPAATIELRTDLAGRDRLLVVQTTNT